MPAKRPQRRRESPRGHGQLSEAEKIFVVKALGHGLTPQQVVDELRANFGTETTRQNVAFYDPTVGETPPQRWCTLYEEARKEFFESVDRVPIAHEAVCLARLEQLYTRNMSRGADGIAMQAIVEARKIRGGFYSNRQVMELANRAGESFQLTYKAHEIRNKLIRRLDGISSRIGARGDD